MKPIIYAELKKANDKKADGLIKKYHLRTWMDCYRCLQKETTLSGVDFQESVQWIYDRICETEKLKIPMP